MLFVGLAISRGREEFERAGRCEATVDRQTPAGGDGSRLAGCWRSRHSPANRPIAVEDARGFSRRDGSDRFEGRKFRGRCLLKEGPRSAGEFFFFLFFFYLFFFFFFFFFSLAMRLRAQRKRRYTPRNVNRFGGGRIRAAAGRSCPKRWGDLTAAAWKAASYRAPPRVPAVRARAM